MFKKNIYFGDYDIDCEENTYTLEWEEKKYEISGKVKITSGNFNLLYIWIQNGKCFTIQLSAPFTLDFIVIIFNQQIMEQIQKMYEPGGKIFTKCERTIKELLF